MQPLIFTKGWGKMLSDFHIHTTFCDGKNTPEEMVCAAIEKGFSAIGFSGHAYTAFDLRYCMTDTDEYIRRIALLKEKYKDKIQVYLGTEEDAFGEIDRSRYDYIIGSSHYVKKDGKYYDADGDYETVMACIDAFGGDSIAYAEAYFSTFCEYILRRKPDIVGHFDLLTKFDEENEPLFLGDKKYECLAEKYLKKALESDCIFEINSGAISRGHRRTPYPAENLLYVIKKEGGKVMMNSDSHERDTLNRHFEEMKKLLLDVGFEYAYTINNGSFEKYALKKA